MDVKYRKRKARALAQKGETAKALAVYREILENLEGSKGILRELPLYVTAGDLCFKEGDTKAALAMYDKAGQLYAQHGSGKSVIAVCGKILEVLPEGINTHLHYARLLIEGGHVGEARKVLVNYAAVFDFIKMQQALEIMEGRSDDDVMPVLEMVLEMAEWSGEEPAEAKAKSEGPEIAELGEQAEEAERESAGLDSLDPVDMKPEVAQPDLAQPGDHEEERADAGKDMEFSKSATDMLEERPVARRSGVTYNIVSEFEKSGDQEDKAKSPADSDSVIVKSGGDWEAEESSIAAREEPPEEEPTGPARAEIPVADIPAPAAVRDSTNLPNINLTPPEGPPKLVTVEDADALRNVRVEEVTVERFSESHPKVSGETDALWPTKPVEPTTPRPAPARPSGSARVVTPRPRPSTPQRRVSGSQQAPGRRGRGKPGPQRPGGLPAVVWVIIAVVVGVALAMLVPFGGRRPAAVADSSADGGAAVVQDVRSTPTSIQPTDNSTLTRFPPVDSILDSPDIELGPPPADFPVGPAEPANVPLIRVEGLMVATVRSLITPGRTGYRVVQILDSGERLTLTVFPIAADAAATMTEGAVQVTSNADGTAEGIVRFGDYEVRARAVISTELLKVLLEQLVEGAGPSN